MSGMSRQFYQWDDYIRGGGPMPLTGTLWGGRVGQARVPVRRHDYPTRASAQGVFRDQTEFFNGGPMSFRMRDRWSPAFGTYGTYGGRRLPRNDFQQILW
jgi:hypothetical protein